MKQTLTIGTFDGVHLGHQAILKSVDFVVTFSNHPQTILCGQPPEALNFLSHKLQLIKQMGVKTILTIPFTQEIAEMSAEAFLLQIKKQLSFTHLLLGHDAAIGRRREGTAKHLFNLSQKLGFTLDYYPPFKVEGEIVSSSLIRQLITQGEFRRAEIFLGRPYSISSTVQKGAEKGGIIGFRTANIDLDNICTPPKGVYAIRAILQGQVFNGIANLGVAPTIQNRKTAVLEAHLFDFTEDLYGMDIEIIFVDFIRNEKQFSSVEELKAQIQRDIPIALQKLRVKK